MTELSREIGMDTISVSELAGKYLTFSLEGEEYGIGIRKVKEIIGMMNIRTIPKAPDYVKGFINLRGKVIPVLDLRIKFGLKNTEYTDRTCIIVVEIKGNDNNILMGTVVDSVSEVLNVKAADIDKKPDFGVEMETDYILGIAKSGDRVKILLDIDKVISSREIEVMSEAA
jgi:purine-binding chemotaxis protein CheW